MMNLTIKSYKLFECDLSSCLYSDRHYKIINEPDDDNENDEEMKYFNIYKEIMDSLHFYSFHLMTSGLRMDVKSDLNATVSLLTHHMNQVIWNYIDLLLLFMKEKLIGTT